MARTKLTSPRSGEAFQAVDMPDVKISGGSLHYEISGDGVPVVFVSGLGGMGSFWDAQVRHLSKDFSIVTYDHRGVGRSNGQPPYSVQQWAEDLLGLFDHLHTECAHLIGHSTGGVISKHFAAHHPERVRSLVLSGTWSRPDRRFCELFDLRKDVLIKLGEKAYHRFGNLLASSSELIDTAEPPRSIASANVLARIDALLAYDGEEASQRIGTPTLVVASADDHIVPAYLSAQLAGGIKGARLVKIKNGGHFFPRTRAKQYTRLLLEFWKSAEPAGKRYK